MSNLREIINNIYDPNNDMTRDFSVFLNSNFELLDHYHVLLRILQDHMMFVQERTKIHRETAAEHFQTLDSLKESVIKSRYVNITDLNEQIIAIVEEVRNFKRQILSELLSGNRTVLLPPTLLSHMLNELEYFRFAVYYVRVNWEWPPNHNLNEHKLWLLDIEGHLQSIEDTLDPVEKLLRKRLTKHKKIFGKLHTKALEFIGYIKHGVEGGNQLLQLDNESRSAVMLYLNLVNEIRELRGENLALGVIDEGMLLHMIFEELYYLHNLEGGTHDYDPIANIQVPLNARSIATIAAMPK